jgi:phosphoglycolate phosphatase
MMSRTACQRPFLGVTFDLDGTLLYTLEDIACSANHALAAHGFAGHRLETYRWLVGDGTRTLIERALPVGARSEETVSACVRTYLDYYGRNWDAHTCLYAGIKTVLDRLADMDMSLAILSNKRHRLTRLCAQTFLNHWHFDPILGQRDNTPKKPSPELAQRIIDRFGTDPGRILYVGDSGVDMETAINAGMYPVGALWGFRSADELVDAGARRLLNGPSDLLPLIEP